MPTFEKPDFERLFEAAPGLYLVLTPEFKIVAASDAYLAATMTRREALLGRAVFDVFPDVRNLRASLERALASKSPDVMAVRKYELRRPNSHDGEFEERFWRPRNQPILGSDGTIAYIIHSVEDVTDVIHLTETNEKIRNSDRIKDEFLATISHELRTPLTLILAPLESLLAAPSEREPKETALLRSMHNNATRLLQLVMGLLDFSSLRAGKVEVKREPLNIAALTRSIIQDFKALAQKKGLAIEFLPSGEEPIVTMDRYLYERILFNLLSNAVKFTHVGGKIRVRTSTQGDELRLSVKDNGIGIPDGEQKKVFERFSQVESSSTRRFEGTGLGLALVREFAGLLEGRVSLESSPGLGSEFVVTLSAPRKPTGEPGALVSGRRATPLVRYPVSRRPSPAPSPRRRFRVLIAEDNEELAQYIASLLDSFCEISITHDGTEALRASNQWHPDLILSDVMMPGLDGITLCRRLKTNPSTAGIPVILITALANREELLKGWEAGADEYLFKPFHPVVLDARVRGLLGLVEARRQRDDEKKRNEELEAFTYLSSHDLNEPLRMITLFSQLLKRRHPAGLPPEAEECLSMITGGAERIHELIEALNAYSAANSREIQFAPVDAEAALQQAITNLAEAITRNEAVITHDPLPAVHGNSALLTQLFQYLIGNALKYRGQEAPRIEIHVGKSGSEWFFSIKDNGIGFEPQYAERIFLVFKRLHRHEEYSGTGIGLSICKTIVERHGGRIWAESEPGVGSTFHFTLPMRDVARAPVSSTRKRRHRDAG